MSTTSPASAPAGTAASAVTPVSLLATLGVFRHGAGDPTTRLRPGHFLRCTHTPDGPGTLLLRWRRDPAPADECGLDGEAWGPGADWMLARIPALTGAHDQPIRLDAPHPVVARALRERRHVRLAASGTLYHELLPTIIAQRITSGEAVRQWRRLCAGLGEPAPGPAQLLAGLVLPPAPSSLRRRPAWWFHPLGIEAKRAVALAEVAAHADKLWSWADAEPQVAAANLLRLRGVGAWTVGSVLGPSLGDPDAVIVGDYHMPHAIAWALAGEARADDRRMLDLLEPYRGQRGRVQAAVLATSPHAPKFGPRRRILPMHRW